MVGASGRQRANKGVIDNVQVIVPALPQQKQIADVLSAYDDLIENNTRRIRILEQMAQAIYREWFVYHRFPGHEKVKMVDSKTKFGKIPEGWKTEKVKDFVDFVRGFEPGSKNYQEQPGEGLILFLRVGDLGDRQSNIFIEKELVGDRVLNKDDIVISMDGSVGIVRMELEGAYSSGIRKIIIKSEALNKPFVWQLLLSEDIQNTIKEHARGTTILHAGESINQMEFVLPTDRIMKEFFDKEEIIMKLLSDLTDQNQNLHQARDLFLPKLVTGEIKI
jgi:type I restriction enzyme S subunit